MKEKTGFTFFYAFVTKNLGKAFFLILLGVLVMGLSEPLAVKPDLYKMAVFPRKSAIETTQAFESLAEYLSQEIGKKIELVVFKDFNTFWKGVEKEEYHLIHYNQYHYIKAHKEFGHQVIVMNEEFGSSTANAAIIVRTDSGLNHIRDLKGKKIIFGGGKKAMQSYIGATHVLRQHGLKKGEYLEEFSINPPNAILAVYHRLGDAGGAGEMLLDHSSVKKRIDVTQLKVLARGKNLPMLCWAVGKNLGQEFGTKIQNAMVNLKNSKKGKAILNRAQVTAFVKTDDDEYDIVREVVREAIEEIY